MDKLSKPVVEDDLHAYVDEALDPVRRREVQEHLDRHPDDAALVATLSAQRQLLRAALAPVADEAVPERLLAALKPSTRRQDRSPWAWRVAAAIVVALGAGGVSGWTMHGLWSPEGGVAVLAGEARSSFMSYAADPIEAGADKGALLRQVSAKLQRPIEVPDLSKSGYQYAGGRLVSTVHGAAGLFFYDRADGTRLALMIRPMAREKEAPMMQQSSGAVGGFSWAAQGLGYSVVGTEAAEVLHPVADEVRSQARARSAV